MNRAAPQVGVWLQGLVGSSFLEMGWWKMNICKRLLLIRVAAK